MPKKITPADADVLLKLYDLRREAEMRKARHWWLTAFNPQSADDFMKIGMEFGSQENNWLRQVTGYWSMAAAIALRGGVDQDLFLEPSFSGEMFVIFAKTKPYVKELREKMGNPHFFANIEQLINSSKKSRDFLKYMEQQWAKRREMAAKKANAS
jgi:hypothetical protein